MATPEISSAGLNGASIDARYLTDRFAAVSPHAANNLARIFNISPDSVQVKTNVKLLHRTELWAWWSDDKLTTTIGLPEDCSSNSLSPCAEKLMQKICLSASGRPSCGWAKLSKIQQVISTERISVGVGKETLDKIVVEYLNGQREALYALFSTENTESYFYEVSMHLPLEILKHSTISRVILSIDELQSRVEKYDLDMVQARAA